MKEANHEALYRTSTRFYCVVAVDNAIKAESR